MKGRRRVRVRGSPTYRATALALLLLVSPARAGGVWLRGETSDPGSLDPHRVSTSIEGHILDELYEGLTVYDDHAVLRPGVASRWEISSDGLTYTFHLRPDARWSNGAPLTAEDFVYSFRRLMDPETGAGYASVLYTLKNARGINIGGLPIGALGVRATDPRTLEMTLEHPATYFLDQLTHFTALPVYRPSVERWGMGFARAGRMVTNGPFVLKSYTPNDRLVLEKSKTFHDADRVALDGEIILPIEDRSAALRRFMGGELDSYDDVPIDQVAYVRDHLGGAFKLTPSLGTYYYAFDTRHKPFDDQRVREALSLVIDRDFLARVIWGRTALPSFSFVPLIIPNYGAPATVAWKDESQFAREDRAEALLRAAGYGPDHPLRLTLRFNQSENHKATAIAIADMWKVLGITTDFIVTDATSYYAFLSSGQPFDVIRTSWFADFPDAQNYLFLAEAANKGLNYTHFADPAYDTLMRSAEREPDASRRSAILHEAEALLLAELPYIPLLNYESPNLVSPKLHGWVVNYLDHHPGRYLSKN